MARVQSPLPVPVWPHVDMKHCSLFLLMSPAELHLSGITPVIRLYVQQTGELSLTHFTRHPSFVVSTKVSSSQQFKTEIFTFEKVHVFSLCGLHVVFLQHSIV